MILRHPLWLLWGGGWGHVQAGVGRAETRAGLQERRSAWIWIFWKLRGQELLMYRTEGGREESQTPYVSGPALREWWGRCLRQEDLER